MKTTEQSLSEIIERQNRQAKIIEGLKEIVAGNHNATNDLYQMIRKSSNRIDLLTKIIDTIFVYLDSEHEISQEMIEAMFKDAEPEDRPLIEKLVALTGNRPGKFIKNMDESDVKLLLGNKQAIMDFAEQKGFKPGSFYKTFTNIHSI